MLRHKAKEVELADIMPDGSTKRVAAAAFYNCLSGSCDKEDTDPAALATKGILKVKQESHFGPIAVRINAKEGEGDLEEPGDEQSDGGVSGSKGEDEPQGDEEAQEEEYDDEEGEGEDLEGSEQGEK